MPVHAAEALPGQTCPSPTTQNCFLGHHWLTPQFQHLVLQVLYLTPDSQVNETESS